jgi:hypothetical protein
MRWRIDPMMVLSAARPDASLREFLVQRARSASLIRLVIDLVVGVTGALMTLLWWKPASPLLALSSALAFTAYGAWGIVDRFRVKATVQTNGFLHGLLDAVCALLTAAGILGGIGMLYDVWAIALGTWIS